MDCKTDKEEYLSYFMSEGCPVLALALQRHTGYHLAVLYDSGLIGDWGEGPEPTPVHAFVIDQGNGEAIDVKGRRTIVELKEDFFDLIDPQVKVISTSVLSSLMGDYRPFYAADDETLALAEKAIGALVLV